MTVMPIVVVALEMVSKDLERRLKQEEWELFRQQHYSVRPPYGEEFRKAMTCCYLDSKESPKAGVTNSKGVKC